MEIIFFDNHQLVVNKPVAMLTQPSGTEAISVEELAKAWIKETYNKPGNVFLHAVHRLDRPVSGIVLFARTSKALSRLNQTMREKRSCKIYCALVEGVFSKEPHGVLEHYLVHDEHQAEVVASHYPQAKLARLHYTVVAQYEKHAFVELVLETGRYHQIRAQLSAIGHPIIGDHRYGSVTPFVSEGIALHHSRLQIPHPITEVEQTFSAPLPPFWPSMNKKGAGARHIVLTKHPPA
jgi:23S rRNA pseudouridine1911/1915/1917 synthase